MMEPILNIKSLTKSFVRNYINLQGKEVDEKLNIIDNLDLIVPKEKITALIGVNGAGKTTLFNLISGFIKPDKGTIDYKGKNLTKMQSYQITNLGIGRMFQDSHIFPQLSVIENMLIADSNTFGEHPFQSIFKRKNYLKVDGDRTEKARLVFDTLFGEDHKFWNNRHSPVGSFSYGEQRLIGLARLFMGDYDVVLLDEPTAGINPSLIKSILSIIRRMVKEEKMTILLIEHNMKVVHDLADICNFMSDGKILQSGPPKEVVDNPVIRKKYFGV